MTNESLKKKVGFATRWSTFAEILTKLITPITSMILARLLTPEIYGIVASIAVITSFADVFTDAGFQKYIIQHEFKDEDDLNKSTNVAFWTNLAISIIFWFAIFLFRDGLATLVSCDGLGIVVAIASLSLPLTSFSSIQMARYKRDFEFKKLFYLRIIGAVLPLFVTVPIAYFTRSYWALIIGTLSANLVDAVLLTSMSKWKPRFFYSFQRLKEMFGECWQILFQALLVWATSYISTFMIGVFLTTYHVGLYKAANNTVCQFFNIIISATSASSFSAWSRLQNDKEGLKSFYLNYIAAIGYLYLPLGIGMFIFRETVTLVFLGNQWLEIATFLGFFSLSKMVTSCFSSTCNNLYIAYGKPKIAILSQILFLGFQIPLIYFSSKAGFTEFCIAYCLNCIPPTIIQLIIVKRVFNINIFNLISKLLPSTISALVMGGVGILLGLISSSIVWNIVAIICCVIVYFTFAFLVFNKKTKESFELLGFNVDEILKKIKKKKSNESK